MFGLHRCLSGVTSKHEISIKDINDQVVDLVSKIRLSYVTANAILPYDIKLTQQLIVFIL